MTFRRERQRRRGGRGLDGYEVTLERYYFDGANWVPDTTKWAAGNTASVAVHHDRPRSSSAIPTRRSPPSSARTSTRALTGTPDLYRSGTYRFDNLETAGLRNVNGTDTWVAYGYKVRVSDPRVTENELFRAKYHLTGAGYREPDLAGDNKLVEPDEYISLRRRSDDGTTPDGLVSHESNIVYAPASNNDDQTSESGAGRERKPGAGCRRQGK